MDKVHYACNHKVNSIYKKINPYWLETRDKRQLKRNVIKLHVLHIYSKAVCFLEFNFLKISNMFASFKKLNSRKHTHSINLWKDTMFNISWISYVSLFSIIKVSDFSKRGYKTRTSNWQKNVKHWICYFI